MAADLVAMIEAVVPGEFVLVAHSMGGLVARRAAERLGPRLRGLLLVDALPETAPVYDTWDQTARKVDRVLAVTQALTRVRPLARLISANVRRLYSADTYQTMLAEDFTPAGTAQTRQETRAVAAAIPQFRAQPPELPSCPTIVLSATRAAHRAGAPARRHPRAPAPLRRPPAPRALRRPSTRRTSSRPSNHTSSPRESSNSWPDVTPGGQRRLMYQPASPMRSGRARTTCRSTSCLRGVR